MAKKYGVGANTGKKATTYFAYAEDGTKLFKKSYIIHADDAYIGAYLFEGKWHASGVASTPQDWGSQVFLKAQKYNPPKITRVKK
jgi:hypothetical protein